MWFKTSGQKEIHSFCDSTDNWSAGNLFPFSRVFFDLPGLNFKFEILMKENNYESKEVKTVNIVNKKASFSLLSLQSNGSYKYNHI